MKTQCCKREAKTASHIDFCHEFFLGRLTADWHTPGGWGGHHNDTGLMTRSGLPFDNHLGLRFTCQMNKRLRNL